MATNNQVNNVSQPPLMTPMSDKSGQLNSAWSNWFRDLYRRTSYKGGNAIDDLDDRVIEDAETIADLKDIAQNHEDRIEVNEGDITQSKLDIQQNTTDIIANTADIEENTDNIETNVTNIGNNAAAITVNTTSIGTNVTNIGTNTTNIGTNTTNIGTNTTDIGNNATAITDHDALESAHGSNGDIVGFNDLSTELVVGLVKRMTSIADAADTTVSIVTADIAAAPASYDQAYTDLQATLTNENKAAINDLASDLNAAIAVLNELLLNSKTSGQMTT
jgi:hypothetical protein